MSLITFCIIVHHEEVAVPDLLLLRGSGLKDFLICSTNLYSSVSVDMMMWSTAEQHKHKMIQSGLTNMQMKKKKKDQNTTTFQKAQPALFDPNNSALISV